MAKIGLVTVFFNSDNVLEGFFKSLSSQSYTDYHLYIVDNTPSISTDECLSDILKKYPVPDYTHFKSETNVGIAKGNNVGIAAALQDKCGYVLLLNNDIEFEQVDLLKLMVHIADTENEALIIPKIYFYDTKKVWMAGGYFQWWKAMSAHIGEWKDDHDQYNQKGHYDYAPTCFMLIQSKVFDVVGMMDEKYFVYYDDTDFAYRASKSGFSFFYCPQFSILHKVGSSTGGYDSPFSIFYGHRNRVYFIRKHYNVPEKIIAFSYFFGTRIVKYIKYDKHQRRELIKAINAGFAMKIDRI